MDSENVVPISRHFCPACGRPMRVVMVIPRFGSFPELHTYECRDCGVSYTEAVKETNTETDRDSDGRPPAGADKLTPR